MQEPVKHWMSGDPVSIASSASVLEAWETLVRHGIHHLPVVDDGRRVVGMLSVGDLRGALSVGATLAVPLSTRDRELALEWGVEDLLSAVAPTIGEESELGQATERMADGHVGCLAVVDEEGRLAGVLSETDLLHALSTRLWIDRAPERAAALARTLEDFRHEHARGGAAASAPGESLDRQRLKALERGLARAGTGRFGRCDGCGGPIDPDQLRLAPDSSLCDRCRRHEPGG